MNMKDFVFTIDVCLQLLTFSAILWKLFSITHELKTGQARNRENIAQIINRLETLEKALINQQLFNKQLFNKEDMN